ncbi:MAG TPA: ATP-binding cassette domain-containing protein [Solirubrobacteraceae bacterium]|jgi:ABC-type lipoprotein export system ATPase subunit
MTPLLSFANVGKRFPDGGREITVLEGVSFEVDAGVFVGLYGARRSGKSTLLRIAAGIEQPDAGTVRFDGRSLEGMNGSQRGRLLRRELAFMASGAWRPHPGESVVDHVAMSLGSDGLTIREARRRALRALERVGVTASCADEPAGSLSLADRTLVMLARAIVHEPRLLLVDEPAVMPSLSDRGRFYVLLREIAREQDMALLVVSEEMGALQGAGLMMSISGGEVCTTAERGTVVPLPRRSARAAERSGS